MEGRKLFLSDDDILQKIRTESQKLYEEQAVGTPNASLKIFYSTAEFNPETLKVYLDGVLQLENTDYYVLNQSSFSFVVAPGLNSIISLMYIPV